MTVPTAPPSPIQPFPHYTCSGKEVWFAQPERTALVLREDFGPTLARMYRYGAALGNVTVLDHLALGVALVDVLCTPALDEDLATLRAYFAAHDLHEAIVIEVPSPLKALLPEYQEIEDLWEAHTHRSIGLGWPRHPDIARIVGFLDRRASAVEMVAMAHPNRHKQFEIAGGPPEPVEMDCWRKVYDCTPVERWERVVAAIEQEVR